LALLLNVAEVSDKGAVLLARSRRTPESRKEPDSVFPAGGGKPGNVSVIVPAVKLIVLIVTVANKPMAPSMRIASAALGRFAAAVANVGLAIPVVIDAGNVNVKDVVVNDELAISAPDTVIPAPGENGSAVTALRDVSTSLGDGVLKS
jgi:hypothetical protein